jgi:hypothetical protein
MNILYKYTHSIKGVVHSLLLVNGSEYLFSCNGILYSIMYKHLNSTNMHNFIINKLVFIAIPFCSLLLMMLLFCSYNVLIIVNKRDKI